MQHQPFLGVVAATHTQFRADGSLNLAVVEKQASHLLQNGVHAVFVGGTTGESHSLSHDERRQLTDRWIDVARGTPLRVVVHVGGNCLGDAQGLAAQAQARGAAAIAAMAPSYFKPGTVADLAGWCAAVAGAATDTPFYFYDIPLLTHVDLSMPELLDQAAGRIPTFVGLKFTCTDLSALQFCLHAQTGRYDVVWGYDEHLLAAMALGVRGAVGSTYNIVAPLYHRLIERFHAGDLAAAREEQFRSARLVALLAGYGFMAATKATLGMLGVDVGPPRLPIRQLASDRITALRADLERLGFFDWL
jgi:N-acetylneuraminate lyase